MVDPGRAVSLYEKSWRDGVPIAASDLGHIYEVGVPGSEATAPWKLQPDLAKAWSWYKKGADAGEPNALARFAEREERNALAQTDSSQRNALLLRAFRLYTAAAERAHDEDWPDDAWRLWRYRRATLARLLASEGMMQQVADVYQTERENGPPMNEPFGRPLPICSGIKFRRRFTSHSLSASSRDGDSSPARRGREFEIPLQIGQCSISLGRTAASVTWCSLLVMQDHPGLRPRHAMAIIAIWKRLQYQI